MATNIFGGPTKTSPEFQEKVETHSKAILTVVERQKDLESNLDLANEKIELLDHNTVKNFKQTFQDTKSTKEEIKNLKKEIKTLKEANIKIAKQLQLMASRDEVTKLEKYIDLWNPMNFLTRDEIEDYKQTLKKEFEKIVRDFMKD